MPNNVQRNISLKSENANTQGVLAVKEFSRKEQVQRAITMLAICWLGAIASIPIILAHYILIPGFLIAGPILAIKRLRTTEEKENASGPCPHCSKPVTLRLEKDDQLPKWVYCPACDKAIELLEQP